MRLILFSFCWWWKLFLSLAPLLVVRHKVRCQPANTLQVLVLLPTASRIDTVFTGLDRNKLNFSLYSINGSGCSVAAGVLVSVITPTTATHILELKLYHRLSLWLLLQGLPKSLQLTPPSFFFVQILSAVPPRRSGSMTAPPSADR